LLSDNFKTLRTPGSSLKHYAPYKDCYILKTENLNKNLDFMKSSGTKKIAVLDFFSMNHFLKDKVSVYENLSKKGQLKEAYKNFYCLLRKIEKKKNIETILLPNLKSIEQRVLFDKIYRAASGRYISINDIV
jgi:hypothetical protein